jgi:hypothetical protein
VIIGKDTKILPASDLYFQLHHARRKGEMDGISFHEECLQHMASQTFGEHLLCHLSVAVGCGLASRSFPSRLRFPMTSRASLSSRWTLPTPPLPVALE